jgi:hypothetical protein
VTEIPDRRDLVGQPIKQQSFGDSGLLSIPVKRLETSIRQA